MIFRHRLISINKTTIEFCEWKTSGSYNYNLGTLDNFKSVFVGYVVAFTYINVLQGSNPLLWLLPCGFPEDDGIYYPGTFHPALSVINKQTESNTIVF